jgi:quercetin dioxygenase-like cupin family protein
MVDGQKWQRVPQDQEISEAKKVNARVSLPEVILSFPPDPNSKARHRANLLVKTDTIRVVLVTMLEGGALQEHSAPGPITVQVLAGTIDFLVDGESDIMSKGDLISLAPGVRHAVRGLKDGAFLLTIGVHADKPDSGGD